MKEIRCPYCNKLLLKAEGSYKLEIKCNKCKNIIEIKECQKEEHQPY
jgi:phage FluMu protein Com